MAYDPTIPSMDHYIGDDIPKIMANFAEIGGSLIVDHNLDVPDPPGGHYIRYANGKQEVWVSVVVDTTQNTAHQFTSPAAFRSGTKKYASYSFPSITGSTVRSSAKAVVGVSMTDSTPVTFYVGTDGSGSRDDIELHIKIHGLW